MRSTVEKVTAFVTRSVPPHRELLLFEHSSAGIQLPAGTVEDGESPAEGAVRDAREETGLVDLSTGRFLGPVTETRPDQHYLVATTTPVYARPNTTSFDWAHIGRSILVVGNRADVRFFHITYAERDEQAHPLYVSYQVTGWVPTTIHRL